ncbi:complex I NDUFA9 subunit family protein [soil metagenome]
MILVVGATGVLGGLITRILLGQGEAVRILVRGGSSYDDLVTAGAQAVTGDLKDPDSLAAACTGVDAVLSTANSAARGGADTVESVDRDGNRHLVDAAAAAGVGRFVFVSALGSDVSSPVPFMRAKAETEQRVRDSGMTWTVLTPNLFMDVWVSAVVGGPALSGQPVTLLGEGRRRHSMVAIREVAAYAVAALHHRAARNQTLVIGGPHPVSWLEVVAAFEQELGRDIRVVTVAPGEPVPGLPDMMSQLIATLESYDSPIEMTGLSATYGVRPTSLTEFVNDFVAATGRATGSITTG